jgi:DNA-binding transcriptional LysR family regulator
MTRSRDNSITLQLRKLGEEVDIWKAMVHHRCMSDVNWNAVYGFWLAAEHGSFANASRALPRGSIQALHKRVRSLETPENLGFRLLRSRGVKGVELTEAGQRLFELLDPVFRNFDLLISEVQGEDSGPLRVAVTGYVARQYASRIIRAYCPRFPKVRLHLHQRESDEAAAMVEAGKADLGICSPLPDSTGFEVRAEAPLRVELVVARGRAAGGLKSWSEVVREPLILPEPTSIVRRAFDQLMAKEHLTREVRLAAELTTPELSLEAVRAGLGVALIAAGPEVRIRGDLRRLRPPPGLTGIRLAVISNKHRHLTRYGEAFVAAAGAVLTAADAPGPSGRRAAAARRG